MSIINIEKMKENKMEFRGKDFFGLQEHIPEETRQSDKYN